MLGLAAYQLKWQHCWPQSSYAFCCVNVQKKNQTRILDTDSVQLKTFAYYLRQISQNT